MHKGTATPLSCLLPVQEVTRAVQHIHDAIRERIDQMAELKGFSADNKSLQKLVLELPQRVSHKIMVPFGSAAFFPGELVHTNEMMVLLGEGYYAEQSAKQTFDILKRRGKYLDSQIEALASQIADLQAEAAFASEAALESAGGFVEIKEDYVEPTEEQIEARALASQAGPETSDQNEYDRLMARLAELEVQEQADENEESSGAVDDMSLVPLTSKEVAPVLGTPVEVLGTPAELEDWETKSELGEKKVKRVSFKLTPEESEKAFMGSVSERAERQESQIQAPAIFNREKAFTGVVIERVETSATDKVHEGKPEKPVSRFKMQRLRTE